MIYVCKNYESPLAIQSNIYVPSFKSTSYTQFCSKSRTQLKHSKTALSPYKLISFFYHPHAPQADNFDWSLISREIVNFESTGRGLCIWRWEKSFKYKFPLINECPVFASRRQKLAKLPVKGSSCWVLSLWSVLRRTVHRRHLSRWTLNGRNLGMRRDVGKLRIAMYNTTNYFDIWHKQFVFRVI